MAEVADIVSRKDAHIDLALAQTAQATSPFDRWTLDHCALPEMDLADVDLASEFLGKRLRAPFLISAMTGGPARAQMINDNLAMAAESLGLALGVGSQRVALEGGGAAGVGPRLRELAPSILLFANLGGAQLALGYGAGEATRAMEMIEADALVVHLNPLQEAVQFGGDTRWSGLLGALERLCRELPVPVIVKEVGFGISGEVARRLQDAGVAAIDVAGAGGTDWAAIEAERASSARDRAIGAAFPGWGLPTPLALAEARDACPELPLIASGGVRHGVDAAKAIALGADLVGQAGPVLAAALRSAEAVVEHFEVLQAQLRIAAFCTGSRNLADLRTVRLIAV